MLNPKKDPETFREKDEDGWRIYRIEEKPYISVTQVLDFFVDQKLKNWFVKTSASQITKRKEETANQGSNIHQLAHDGTEPRLNALFSNMGAEIIESEFLVKSKNGWAGTVDKTIRLGNKNYLVDIKTGRFGHAALQLAAYTLAHNEEGGDIQGVGVISLPRDGGEAKFFDYSEHMEQSQYAWCCGFDVWKHHYFKKLLSLEWFETKTALSYNWSFK